MEPVLSPSLAMMIYGPGKAARSLHSCSACNEATLLKTGQGQQFLVNHINFNRLSSGGIS